MSEKLAYSVRETADLLGVCLQTVRNMCAEHKLPHIRIGAKGDRVLIPAKSLHEYLEKASASSQQPCENTKNQDNPDWWWR